MCHAPTAVALIFGGWFYLREGMKNGWMNPW